MITKRYENRDAWLADRLGKITGSKVNDVITKRGNGKKVGFWQLVADRLALPDDGEMSPMDRGNHLEERALERFEEETGKKVDKSLLMWMRDDDQNIAYSPDGIINDTEAVEVKCLKSALHIEALVTQSPPDKYHEQIIQAFVVNEKLQKLYMVFYDPRMTVKDFFFLEIHRDEKHVETYLEMERRLIEEVNEIVEKLTDF